VRGMWHAFDELEVRTKFWSENLKRRGHFTDLDVDGRII
jgi:hypothetical protein